MAEGTGLTLLYKGGGGGRGLRTGHKFFKMLV